MNEEQDDECISTHISIVYFKHGARFPVWKTKMQANACRYHYNGIVDGSLTVPTKTEYLAIKAIASDARTPIQKTNYSAYGKNTRAYSDLINSMDDSYTEGFLAWKIVHNAMTVDLPDGDAYLA